MVRHVTICLLVMLLPFVLFAGTVGKITGTVVDKATGEGLAGVNVIVEGTTLGSATDADGYYMILSVPVGTFNVRASYIGYKELVVQNLRVSMDLTAELNFELESTTLEFEEVIVTAQRKLFEKSSTASISITTAEDLENIPIRGTQNIIATSAGVIVQNGDVHIRGGRDNEVGYYVDGATTVNPMTNVNVVHVIDEAIEEIQVLAGGYTADLGGANSGVVKTKLKTGTPNLKGSIDYRVDGFGDPEEGKKMLDTYSYGHQTGILTLSGPLLTDKITFFLAGEYRNRDDWRVRYSEGFDFSDFNLVDKNPSNTIHDSISTFAYPDGFTPKQNDKQYSLNGTLTLDFPVRLTFSGMYTGRKYDMEDQPMLDLLNDRKQYDERSTLLLTGKATKMFSPKSILEVKVSSYNYSVERNDSWFDNEWEKWYDSTEVYAYSDKHFDEPVIYRDSWRPKYDYVLNGFPCERNGSPTTWYRTEKHSYLGAAADYQAQIGSHHDVKTGLDYRAYTVSHFDINPSVMNYTAENGTFAYTTYGSMKEVPANKWMNMGGIDAYGYDIYGNETSDVTKYYQGDTLLAFTDGPRKPKQFATYLMDKIEYNDLIVNAGIRLDYFDSDDKELKDPANPEVDQGTQMIAESAWEEVKPFIEISPRLGFSFPTDEKTAFYLQYGKFVQMPSLNRIYFSNYNLARQIVWQGYYFLNPIGYGLEPIRTTSYEIGLRRQIAENVALDVCAFYKNVKGLIQIFKQLPTMDAVIPGYYDRFVNGDFVTTKGLEFRLTLRRMNRLNGNINYTLTNAEGTASNSQGAHGAVYMNTILPSSINPLDYSQTHTGSINLDYRFGKDDGGPILEQFGINLLINFSSGHPYTYVYVAPGGQVDPYSAGVDYMLDTRSRQAMEAVGSSITPWILNADLRLDKSFDIGPVKATAYVIVNNLFNRKNTINVYQRSGNAEDDGYLSDPNYSASTIKANKGQQYIDMYSAINMVNAQSYWDIVGDELYGTPRQIFFGIKVAF